MACGEIGLNLNYFYSLTPRQFYNIVEGYSKKEDQLFKRSWEQTRLLAFYAAYNFESKDKNLTPEKFYPLPWEQKKKVSNKPKMSLQEVKELFNKIDENKNRELEQ